MYVSKVSHAPATRYLLAIAICTAVLVGGMFLTPSGARATGAPAADNSVFGPATDAHFLPLKPAEKARMRSLVRNDEEASSIIALRPVKYDIRYAKVQQGPLTRYLVLYLQGSKPRLLVFIAGDLSRITNRSGQNLYVTPGRNPYAHTVVQRWWFWLPLFAAFVVTASLRGHSSRRWMQLTLVPLLVISFMHLVTLLGLIPASHVRAGNIVVSAVTYAALVFIALTAVRIATRPAWLQLSSRDDKVECRPLRPLLPSWVLGAVAISGLVAQVLVGRNRHLLVDVAYAGVYGGSLMRDGVPVYGHIVNLPGFLMHPDTYGPFIYMSYIPALHLTDTTAWVAMITNIVATLVCAVATGVIGYRFGGLRWSMWGAAMVCCCPFLLITTGTGHNDILVAAAAAVMLACIARPGTRGALVGLALGMKFVPGIILLCVLRMRNESRWRAALRVLAGAFAVVAIGALIGLHGHGTIRVFWEHTFKFQARRDDIQSLWGLLGYGSIIRLAWYAVLAVLLVWVTRLSLRDGLLPYQAAAWTTAVFVTGIMALTQFWYSYAIWIVPTTLAIVLFAQKPGEDDSPEETAASESTSYISRERQPEIAPL